jgi:hypothetical protein
VRGAAPSRGLSSALSSALAIVACAALSSCVSPALDDGQFDTKALKAVEAASSEVATGSLVVRNDLADQVLGTYADVVVTGSETALGSISASFGSVQPPSPGSDETRDAVLLALSDAEDALAHARIAVRRSDRAQLEASLAELEKSSAALDRLDQDLS